MTRSVIQLGGQALKLDADGDTTIQVSSDDVLIVDTAGNEALKIDASGHVTKPLQPAFMATLSANVNNIAVSSAYSLVCNTEIFDNNGDYDTSNGTFTAPGTDAQGNDQWFSFETGNLMQNTYNAEGEITGEEEV